MLVERRGHRRAGRPELADRELPRLPRRGQRRPAHRPGPAAGGQVRRRDPHRARRRRPGGARRVPGGPLRRRRRGRRPHRGAGHRRRLPQARRARASTSSPAGASSTARPPPRPRPAPARTSTSSAGPTRPARRRCSSPGTPAGSPCWCAADGLTRRCRTTSSTRSRDIANIEVRPDTEVVGAEGDEHLGAAAPLRHRRPGRRGRCKAG